MIKFLSERKKEAVNLYPNKITQYRKKQKMTIKELAEKVGISAGYLCHLEKGTRQNPSTKVMQNIAKALNTTIAELFF